MVLLRTGRHQSLYRDTHEDDGETASLRSHYVKLVRIDAEVVGYLPAEFNLLLVFWVEHVLQTVRHADVILVFQCNGSVIEEHHPCCVSASLLC